jgi:hypothetical protein
MFIPTVCSEKLVVRPKLKIGLTTKVSAIRLHKQDLY